MTDQTATVTHRSEPILVSLYGHDEPRELALVQTDLADGVQGPVLVMLNNTAVCAIEDAPQWIAALQQLVAMAGIG